MKKNSQGFTLVELLIVITILAILATVGALYYVGLNSKARDSGRKADLYEISIALEVNKNPEGYIPLDEDQFSSFQWSDPLGNAYCIAAGNPVSPVTSIPWGSLCPIGFITVAPGAPAGNFQNWKVCTFLENPDSGKPNVFCKSAGQ